VDEDENQKAFRRADRSEKGETQMGQDNNNNQEFYAENGLAVKKIALFSSGLGFFELRGELRGASRVELPFDRGQMDDVLKSLTVYDPESVSPYVSYPSEKTMDRTLESLRIDLRGEPTMEKILSGLKGESVEIETLRGDGNTNAQNRVTGKIVSVQTRKTAENGACLEESVLTLFSDGKLAQMPLRMIESYRFCDPGINESLADALRFLSEAVEGERCVLKLCLDGVKPREVQVGFVVAAPVWKANYRLDMGGQAPFLQGWALVDNAGDTDWNDVELSLVVGRPVSFTQPYYAPLFLSRPMIPLAIAGFAQAQTYDSGYGNCEEYAAPAHIEAKRSMERMDALTFEECAAFATPSFLDGGLAEHYETTGAKTAGEHFAYTLKNKITLPRQQSAMVPLAQGALDARKVVIFNTAKGPHPALGIELSNNLGVKLPAGAITVCDDGLYAGDALLDFLPQGEKRLVSYGDDLSVRGIVRHDNSNFLGSVKISKGVLTIATKMVYGKSYTFKNNADTAKTLILEHPITSGAILSEPVAPMETTAQYYRFEICLDAQAETAFNVTEEGQHTNSISFLRQPYSAVSAYFRNDSYPAHVRGALRKAESLADEADRLRAVLDNATMRLEQKTENQSRIRENLSAVRDHLGQSQVYIDELATLDRDIAAIYAEIETLQGAIAKAQTEYEDYLAQLDI
jgi:hypothetical protein